MKYRHERHAANQADLIKHLALMSLGNVMTIRRVWDAFAARPCYALEDLPVKRRQQLDALMASHGTAGLQRWQAAVQSCHGEKGRPAYPGSAYFLSTLPFVESLLLTEREMDCTRALEEYFANDGRVVVRALDSYRQAGDCLPSQPQLVFIDPPFLSQAEWVDVQGLLKRIRALPPGPASLLWYPLRKDLEPPPALARPGDLTLRVDFGRGEGMEACVLHYSGQEGAPVTEWEALAAWLQQTDALSHEEVRLTRY